MSPNDLKTLLIIIGSILVVIILFLIFRPRKIETKPFCYIKDANGNLIFLVYQINKIYKVVNYVDDTLEPVEFDEWDDVSSYVKLSLNEWYIDKKD
jgi:hypothetical protein